MDELDTTVRLYADHFYWDTDWEIFPEGYAGVYTDGLLGNPETENRTLGGEITTNYVLADHLLTVGANYEKIQQVNSKHTTNFNPNTYAPLGSVQDISVWGNWIQDANREIWAVYLQDVWGITENASLTAGVRHDDYSNFGGTTNPRIGFVWEFRKDFTIKLLYGSAFRAPTFTELYSINNPAEIGNPDLKPEKIDTYEAGIEYLFLDNYTLRLNYFYNYINDLITLGPKPSPTEAAPYINQGKVKIDGVEAELVFDFAKGNYGYINCSYQNPKDGDTDERVPDVPNWRANTGLNLGLIKYLNANVNVSWTGERPRAVGDYRSDLSSTTIVDLILIAKKFYKTFEIKGSVHNLFDEDYRDPSPYPAKVINDYPTNGRTFLMEVRYTF